MRLRRFFVGGTLAALVVLSIAHYAEPTRTTEAAASSVTIVNFQYSPDPIAVSAGTTVTWTNHDSAWHSATGSNFDTGRLEQNSSGSVTFTAPGTYQYTCSHHPSMHGTLIVQGAVPTDTPLPPTNTPVPPTDTPVPASSTPTPPAITATTTVPPPPPSATATITPTQTSTTAPTSTDTPVPAQLVAKVSGTLRVGRPSTITVSVTEDYGGSTVSGATVVMDARKAGIARKLKTRTNGSGKAVFRKVKTTRTGTVLIAVSKSGMVSTARKIKAKP